MLTYAKPFWAKCCLVIGNLYPHMCTKFGEFTLTFNEFGAHFSRVPSFSPFLILSIAVGFWTFNEIYKCRLLSSQKLCYGYVTRLTHIFAAGNGHKHLAISKTVPELIDTLQQIWTAMLQKSIAKGVKDFPKRLEASVSANVGHFEYKMWSKCCSFHTNIEISGPKLVCG